SNYAKEPVKYCGITISSNVPQSSELSPKTTKEKNEKTPQVKKELLMINPTQNGGSLGEMELISFLLSNSLLL
ncbi:MAG: hypothetical protein WD512_01450, partial [Candidatus Paceibacterota bacterium]